jgi:hypothetical protein
MFDYLTNIVNSSCSCGLVQIERRSKPISVEDFTVNLQSLPSPTLARLIEEVRTEGVSDFVNKYNRYHNRHNRSR